MIGVFGWGFIGFGWVARDYAAPALAAAGGRLVAVADPDPRARAAAEALGARAYDDVAAMAADEEVRAVYVATPNHLHAAGVAAAAGAGRPVLCEKPMAATLDDAEAMAACVRRSGVRYGTAFDQRHHPAHAAIRRAVSDGVIGRVTAVRIVYACWVGPDFAADNWRADPVRAGGGALMDLAPHGLDLAAYLLGEPVGQVAAFTQRRVHDYPVDDGALVAGVTAGGILMQMHVAYNCPEALPRRRLEIMGTRGQIVAERTMGQTAGGDVFVLDGGTGARRALPVADAHVSPFVQQMAAFARYASGEEDGTFDMSRDLHSMRLLAGAYRSARSAWR